MVDNIVIVVLLHDLVWYSDKSIYAGLLESLRPTIVLDLLHWLPLTGTLSNTHHSVQTRRIEHQVPVPWSSENRGGPLINNIVRGTPMMPKISIALWYVIVYNIVLLNRLTLAALSLPF